MARQTAETRAAVAVQMKIFAAIEEEYKKHIESLEHKLGTRLQSLADTNAERRLAERKTKEAEEKAANAKCQEASAVTALVDIRKAIEVGVCILYPKANLHQPTAFHEGEIPASHIDEEELRLLRRLHQMACF